jgi:hypothetical protein
MRKLLYIFVVILIIQDLFADTVFLKNGKVIQGKIINQSQTKVEIQTEDGNRILLNKEEIRRIQFGPTQNEIELEKRRQEEQKKIEEQRRKQEEEIRRKQEEEIRRKQEEEKRLEEERRRQEERKKPKEPIIRRENLEIGYGLGPSYSIPSFVKINDIFLFAKYIGSLLVDTQPRQEYFNEENRFKKYHSNTYFFISYYFNNWAIGLDITFILLNQSIEARKYGLSHGSFFFPLISAEFQEEPEYSYSRLWFKYDGYRFNLNNKTTILGIKGGFYTVYTNLRITKISDDLFNDKLNFTTIYSRENGFLFLGPSLTVKFSLKEELQIDFGLINGGFKGKYDNLELEFNKSVGLWDRYNSVNISYSGKGSGEYFSLQYNQNIYEHWFFFARYFISELVGNNTKNEAIASSSNVNRSITFFTGPFYDLITFGQKKTIIEKNQSISVGIGYNFE